MKVRIFRPFGVAEGCGHVSESRGGGEQDAIVVEGGERRRLVGDVRGEFSFINASCRVVWSNSWRFCHSHGSGLEDCWIAWCCCSFCSWLVSAQRRSRSGATRIILSLSLVGRIIC